MVNRDDSNHSLIFPPPPRSSQWPPDANYFNELNRWFETISRFIGGVVYLKGYGLYFPGLGTIGALQEVGYGLRPGEVFSNNGVLTIVRENDVWMAPVSATTGLGTLSVHANASASPTTVAATGTRGTLTVTP